MIHDTVRGDPYPWKCRATFRLCVGNGIRIRSPWKSDACRHGRHRARLPVGAFLCGHAQKRHIDVGGGRRFRAGQPHREPKIHLTRTAATAMANTTIIQPPRKEPATGSGVRRAFAGYSGRNPTFSVGPGSERGLTAGPIIRYGYDVAGTGTWFRRVGRFLFKSRKEVSSVGIG